MATVDGLVPHLAQRGIRVRRPALRGHRGQPTDLVGVTWRDWYADARRALDQLLDDCARVFVVGLSMGGVIALHLAAERGDRLAGVVAIAPALRLRGTPAKQVRLAFNALLGRDIVVDPANAYQDPVLAARSSNYPVVPARTVLSLVTYGRMVARLAPRIETPLLVVYTPRDRVVDPGAARQLYKRVSTPVTHKRILAFPGSGHEMLLDHQAQSVMGAIIDFVESPGATASPAPLETR